MNTFLRFFYEFISVFFDGFFSALKGLWSGITKMFSFGEYAKIISSYKDNFYGAEKIFVVIGIVLLKIIVLATLLLVVLTVRAIIRKFGSEASKD